MAGCSDCDDHFYTQEKVDDKFICVDADQLSAMMARLIAIKSANTHLAEYYTSDKIYKPGTVVCYGSKNEFDDREVWDRATVGDPRVAGVVVEVNEQTRFTPIGNNSSDSCNNDDDPYSPPPKGPCPEPDYHPKLWIPDAMGQSKNPALLMNSELIYRRTGPFVAVALQGRTKCKVSGPVRKGDLLVTDGEGGATAAGVKGKPGPGPYQAAVIGKSLVDCDELHSFIDIAVWHA